MSFYDEPASIRTRLRRYLIIDKSLRHILDSPAESFAYSFMGTKNCMKLTKRVVG